MAQDRCTTCGGVAERVDVRMDVLSCAVCSATIVAGGAREVPLLEPHAKTQLRFAAKIPLSREFLAAYDSPGEHAAAEFPPPLAELSIALLKVSPSALLGSRQGFDEHLVMGERVETLPGAEAGGILPRFLPGGAGSGQAVCLQVEKRHGSRHTCVGRRPRDRSAR